MKGKVKYKTESIIKASLIAMMIVVVFNFMFFLDYRSHTRKIDQFNKERTEVMGILNWIRNLHSWSHMSVRGYLLDIGDSTILKPYNSTKSSYERAFRLLEDTMNFVTPVPAHFDIGRNNFKNFIDEFDEIIRLHDEGYNQEATHLYAKTIKDNAFNDHSDQIKKAYDAEYLEYISVFDNLMFYSMTLQIVILMVMVPVIIFVLIRFNKVIKKRSQMVKKISNTNKKVLFDDGIKNEEDEEATLHQMIDNLNAISEYIANIRTGNYDQQWKEGIQNDLLLKNRETIVGRLDDMRVQLLSNKKEDELRTWHNVGLSHLNDVLRKYNDSVAGVSSAVVKFLTQYMSASMCAMYVTHNNEEENKISLQMSGCYAFDRHKHLQDQLKPGQGLVGQCLLEKEPIYMVDIPDDYFNIKSGLGETQPKTIVIMPMMFNDRIEGVVEIASLHEISDKQREFLQKAAESVAAALNNITSQEQMSHLLHKAQEGSDQLHAQEEELRQNMEELEATHEEMNRKQNAYEAILAKHGINVQAEMEKLQN